LETLRSRGELDVEPRITISTIHGAKGAEAENVAIISDMTRNTADAFRRDPDSEHRVFYVAVTRARENLYLILPQGKEAYPWPSI
jgi:DNA helicase-2/ATP-dependent DNA helicase PcrA